MPSPEETPSLKEALDRLKAVLERLGVPSPLQPSRPELRVIEGGKSEPADD